MKKKGKIVIPVIFVFFLAIIIGFGTVIYSQIQPPLSASETSSQDIRFEIPMGTSVYKISQELKASGVITNDRLFYYFVRYPKLINLLYPNEPVPLQINLKSGIYHLNASMNYAQLVNELSSGQQEYIKVAVPEGKTISQIGQILEEAGICAKEDFKAAAHDTSILKNYGIPSDSAEGYLFPETYFLTKGMSAKDLVKLMLDTFFQKIGEIEGMQDKNPDQLFETVILASIVEREYRVEEEAPLIASVFTNRLKKGIGLYSCATIVYILTEIQGKPHPDRILIEDTKIDSPYNTYKWAGLTPGPISNPGLVALSAAANPPKTNYYFFQVSDSQAGKHVFTSTFDEHKASHNLNAKK